MFMKATFKRLGVKSFKREGLKLKFLEAELKRRDGDRAHLIRWDRENQPKI